MSVTSFSSAPGRGQHPSLAWIAPSALGVLAAFFALIHSRLLQAGIVALVLIALLAYWTLLRPHRWIMVFIAAAILLPPLPLKFGDSGPHPALLFAAIGVLAGILAMPEWKHLSSSLSLLLILFASFLVASSLLAAIYSGFSVGMGSLIRAILFAIGPYLFLYSLHVPGSPASLPAVRLLFRFATIAALFACFDFHYQWPAPAGYEPQFIWLGELVLRRAQGLFYEASTLGNFCAFFLVMILSALAEWRHFRFVGFFELLFAAAAFSLALVFSYSRASLMNVLAAGCLMFFIRGARLRPVLVGVFSLLLSAVVIYTLVSDFGQSYWLRVQYSILHLSDAPAQVFSGRISSWTALIHFIAQHPWHLLFGIGYKTLPYSEFAGQGIVADNTYLQLLVETGTFGLLLFLVLNGLILRAALIALKSPRPEGRFFGKWMTCFWAGELVQMGSGDLITYWRVLPIYFFVLACAIRESDSAFRLHAPAPHSICS
ncbi:MAG: O-antigen ligase family protein [Acidobacteriaceae bacterium]|nr:O-antigen ligase family protein [Acidobacteriaceae bacterium]